MIRARKEIEDMDEYSPPLEGRRGMLRLDFNENTIGCSPKVLQVINHIKEEEIAAYPEYKRFRAKLADSLNIKPDQLIVTNATDEAISIVVQTYVDKGEEAIVPVPTFAMFKFYLQIAGARITEISYNSDLTFPINKVMGMIGKKTRLVILCNPNNPTGTLIEKKDIIRIFAKAQRFDALVLLDEAYYEFSGLDCIDLIDRYDNLIVLRTFSKAYGLGGLRLGYACANKDIVNNLLRCGSPYSVNTVAITAGLVAIDDKEYVKWYVGEVHKGKKILYDALAKLGVKTYPSWGNFLIAKFPKRAKEIEEGLKERGILVRDRSDYPLLKDCLRIGIGTKKQAKKLAGALQEIMR
jgi:histidinol-phosphate aminotransferase